MPIQTPGGQRSENTGLGVERKRGLLRTLVLPLKAEKGKEEKNLRERGERLISTDLSREVNNSGAIRTIRQ